MSVPDIARQMRAEGIHTIVVLSDNIGKWTAQREHFPSDVEFHDRSALDEVQKRLREVKGVSILIYEQTCATEKRRRRKRGKLEDPAKRVMINSLVCEGCGDCGKKSFCVSVLPKETEFGRKREIDQSNCNKDYSCVNGFCPSFVTVHGQPRKGSKRDASTLLDNLPAPTIRGTLEQPWNILITGVGGTGVVTIGALLGMAGHLEGKGATVLDQTGLAQKGGAVTTHIRIARRPDDIHAVRIAAGEADLVLGCDMVVVNDYWALSKVRAGRSQVVLNTYEAMPGTFTTRPDMQFPAADIIAGVRVALGPGAAAARCHPAGHGASGRCHRRQPVHPRLCLAAGPGAAVVRVADARHRAERRRRGDEPAGLRLGPGRGRSAGSAAGSRLGAQPPHRYRIHPGPLHPLPPGEWEGNEWGATAAPRNTGDERELRGLPSHGGDVAFLPLDDARLSRSLDEMIERRAAFLVEYQDAAYATRYRDLVARVRATEAERIGGSTALTETVARYLFKLMAYKDEYEVARLYTSGDFQRRLQQQFEGDYQLRFHLAPPLFARKDEQGRLLKKEYGPWMFKAFGLLAKLKFLRGGRFDVFGRTEERRMGAS